MRLLNFAGPLIAAVLSAGLVAGCVAPPPPQVDVQSLNISTFEVLVAPDPLAVSWPQAEEEYLASRHLDRNIGGVVIGAIIESQRQGEPYGRLSANYANKLYMWIMPRRG